MATDRQSRLALRLHVTPLGPSSVVVEARGHIDASKAVELNSGIRKLAAKHTDLVIDLTNLDFVGTKAVSILLALHECLYPQTRMVVVPSRALTRVIRHYPHATALVVDSPSAALAAAQGPGLYLVDDSR